MKKNLIITGKKTDENSALLRKILSDRISYAGGYITLREDIGEDDYKYYLYPACFAAGIPGLSGEEFFHFSYNGTEKNTEVFRNNGAQLLDEALFYPYAVIDQFGGFEILVPQYRYKLEELLNSDIPVAGVLLNKDDVLELKYLYGLGEKLDDYINNLHSALSKNNDTLVIDSDNCSKAEMLAVICQWADQFAVI